MDFLENDEDLLWWLFEEVDPIKYILSEKEIAAIVERRKKVAENVWRRDNKECFYCELPLTMIYGENGEVFFDSLTVDHIVEKRNGGARNKHNLVACCPACNSGREKRRMTAEEFLIWRYQPRNRKSWCQRRGIKYNVDIMHIIWG